MMKAYIFILSKLLFISVVIPKNVKESSQILENNSEGERAEVYSEGKKNFLLEWDFTYSLFMMSSLSDMIRVRFPDSVQPNQYPYWSRDGSGHLGGFYVDYLKAIFKEAGIKEEDYMIEKDNKYESYNQLGNYIF